jgi:hypothetical protein
MIIVVTDDKNNLIACIDDTKYGKRIIKDGYKYFIAPKSQNMIFHDNDGKVECYPKIILKSEKE